MIFNLLISLLINLSANAYTGPNVLLEGTVRSFNDKEVELVSRKKTYKIPRDMILLADVKMNQQIIVEIPEDKFKELQKNK